MIGSERETVRRMLMALRRSNIIPITADSVLIGIQKSLFSDSKEITKPAVLA